MPWRPQDLERLYTSFGSKAVDGPKHRLYIHPSHQDLRATRDKILDAAFRIRLDGG
jgi:hypothetical protein